MIFEPDAGAEPPFEEAPDALELFDELPDPLLDEAPELELDDEVPLPEPVPDEDELLPEELPELLPELFEAPPFEEEPFVAVQFAPFSEVFSALF